MAKKKDMVRQSNLSQEKVQDSSDEDGSVGQVTPKAKQSPASQKTKSVQKPLKGSKSKPPSPESEEESTDESSEVESGQDDSDSESATSSASSQKRTAPATADSQPRKKTKTAKTSSTVQIAPKPFKAPAGYAPVVVSASDYASEVGSLFGDLSAKQIWHISVPDGVSIDSIKELDIEAAIKGAPILSKNGIDYNLRSVHTKNEVVLLPQGTKMNYRQSAKRVERVLHLQEMSTTESKDETPLLFTATGSGNPKPVRKQPEGLKMRYVPYGAPPIQEPAEGEDEDVEMRDTLDMPPELEQTHSQTTFKKSKKSKRDGADGTSPEKKSRVEDGQASSEKKKKKRKSAG
ncbi:hypothetical protein A1O1_03183 [Capronia coronata CBS 617.96]|uniref:DNA-directed RNA polymerase I subunit RPA34 n=1 Tax=Capronia coronata CBS 617.96 TaxID=1182541 RepID=W9YYK8_9EURO|nr:uncharacterized protein A1O1_03183 [Capronia coronata CBS 617.96]EXJ94785.1 hypothetical protein A1O1_03183 [Capronia coronata CBS 617.96]